MEGGSGGPDEVTKPSGGGNMAKRAVEDPIFECLLALERAAKKATTNDDDKRRLMAATGWFHIKRRLADPKFEDWPNRKLAEDGWRLVRTAELGAQRV
jgi:hypothetical protein